MTRIMFRELKSDIIVVDKLLETTSANYSKSTHRIKNVHMQNMSLLLLLYDNPPGSLPMQSVYMLEQKKSNLAITITANKMDASKKIIDSKSTGTEG